MRGLTAIYRRELAGLFLAPLAWVLLFLALSLQGWLFVRALQEAQGDVTEALRFVFGSSVPFWILLVVLPPLLTMRTISEEASRGMLEFLLTAPVTDAAVVVGKFLASVTFMALLWSSALLYGLVLAVAGTPPDWPPLIGSVVGAVLCSALFCPIATFASAASRTPMLAFFLAFVANSFLLLLPVTTNVLDSGPYRAVVRRLDVMSHFHRSFSIGVMDSAALVFLVAWSAFFVFLAVRRVEMQRWRG